jgi:nucleoside-diphosphate-sugar epimerase/ABC-type branched-subunit amino acid transport system substrate-binding protein
MITRRAVLAGTSLLGIAGAKAQETPIIRIGVLNDQSSTYRDNGGLGSVACVKLAVTEAAAKLGLKAEVVSADHQNKPDVAMGIARQWLDQGVDAICDIQNSSIALAVSDLVRQRDKVLLAFNVGTSALTGAACSPNTIHWAYDTWMLSRVTTTTLVQQGGDSWFFIRADYAFGRALETDATGFITKAGGHVVGSVAMPFPSTDFGSALLAAQSSGAKVIGLANAGDDLVNCIKQAAEFGITQHGQRLAALLMFINNVHSLGLKSAQGLVLASSFYWDTNERTRAFAQRGRRGGAHEGSTDRGRYLPTRHDPHGWARRLSGLSVPGETARGKPRSVGLLHAVGHRAGGASLAAAGGRRLSAGADVIAMSAAGKIYLITGGASLIGSHIADALLAYFALGTPETIAHLMDDARVKLVRGDILRMSELLDAADGADGIFALAGFLTIPMFANPSLGVQVNTVGLLNTLEAARFAKVRRTVFASSVAAYGNTEAETLTEDAPTLAASLSPVSAVYGISKLFGESLCRLYAQRYGVTFNALRFSSVYGDRQHTRAVNANFIADTYERVRKGERPIIIGDGREVHDYIHVADVAAGCVAAMASDQHGHVMNLVTGVDSSLADVVAAVLRVCRSPLEPEYRPDTRAVRSAGGIHLGFSRAKAEATIGWTPKLTLEDGIRRYIAWLEKQAA